MARRQSFRRPLVRRHEFVALLCLSFPAIACVEPVPESPTVREAPSTESKVESLTDLTLSAGAAWDRRTGAGESDVLGLVLASGDFLELELSQDRNDLVVTVFDPVGSRLFELDSPVDPGVPERLLLTAAIAGRYRFEVRGYQPAEKLSYSLSVHALRAASARDKLRARGARLAARAGELRRRGDSESLREAARHYREAASLFRRSEDDPEQAECLFQLGKLHVRHQEYLLAQVPFEQALELYRALEAPSKQAIVHSDLGVVLRRLGFREQAREHLRKAVALSSRLGRRRVQAAALNNLGNLALAEGHLAEAERWYGKALTLWSELGDLVNEAITWSNLGEIYTATDEPEIALLVYEQALSRLDSDERPKTVARIHALMANAAQRLGDLETAETLYRRALAIQETAGNRPRLAETLDGLGRLLYKREQYQRSTSMLRRSLQMFQEAGDRRGEGATLQNLAWALLKSGHSEDAREHFRRSLHLARETGHRRSEAATLLGLAQLTSDRGELLAARDLVKEALRVIEGLRQSSDRIDLRSALLASKQRYFDIAIDILMRLYERDRSPSFAREAFEISEWARGRRLLDVLRADGDPRAPARDPAIHRERVRLRRRVGAAEQRYRDLRSRGAPAGQVAVAEADLLAALMAYRQVHERLASEARTTSPGTPVLTLPAVQRLLDDRTLLLQFALGEERSFLWVVSSDSLTPIPLAGAATLEAAARSAYDLLSHSALRVTSLQVEIVLRRLADLLLGEVAELLRDQRLLFAPEGALAYIPFGALPRPGGGDRPLLLDHEIVHLPSVSVVARMRKVRAGRPPAPKTLAVIGDPVFERDDPRIVAQSEPAATGGVPRHHDVALERSLRDLDKNELRRLPYAGVEARAILALVPESERFAALGVAASSGTMTSGVFANYRIVHVATHGLLNDRHPELSGIVLSLFDAAGAPIDGFVHAHQLHDLDLPADLVVLSACESGLGTTVHGEGLVGLAHGFMRAGVSRVIVSLWKVNDRAAATLMERTYRGMLRHDLSPAEALRKAQLALWQADRWRRPYYWAGFVLQGEWLPVAKQPDRIGVLLDDGLRTVSSNPAPSDDRGRHD